MNNLIGLMKQKTLNPTSGLKVDEPKGGLLKKKKIPAQSTEVQPTNLVKRLTGK